MHIHTLHELKFGSVAFLMAHVSTVSLRDYANLNFFMFFEIFLKFVTDKRTSTKKILFYLTDLMIFH
jgi:hypothetical protein